MPDRHDSRIPLAQWWIFAFAWLIHGSLLFYLFFTMVPGDVVSLGQRAAIVMAICFLLVVEIGILALVNGGFEVVTRRVRQKRWLDAVKGTGLAVGLALLGASILKFKATGVHLKTSDLWFAFGNFRQLLAESQTSEVVALLAVPLGTLALAFLISIGLHRSRRASTSPRLMAFLGLTLVSGLGFGYLYLTSPGVRLFTINLAPEGYWLSRLSPGLLDPSGVQEPSYPAEAAALGADIEPYTVPEDFEHLNVVLIMLESIPWKLTSLGDDPLALMPNLERLTEESVVFTRAYATSTHSDYAQMSILSSLHPRKYDRHDYYTRIEYPRTLIWDILEEAGYSTSLFSCQNERWGNMLSYLDTPGLEVLRHSPNWPRARHKGRQGVESKVYEETPVAEWMEWRDGRGVEPYFTYLNFQSNHFPYEVPPEAPRPRTPYEIDVPVSFLQYPEEVIPVMLNRFYNALHYADDWVGRVVDFLKERGEWERTVLIVVSDHGESFYEHGVPTHGTSLFEEQVRSLLLMRLPGEEPRWINEPVSLLDIMPTLLEYLGLPPHGNFQGRSDIFEPDYSAAGRPIFFSIQGLTLEDGVLLDGVKYIVNWDRRQRALFDLRIDTDEQDDLLRLEPELAESLDRVLMDFLRGQVAYYDNRMWEAGRYPAVLP
ncbi:MAG: sulfatase [Thermoanaerobaculia bacterium]